MIAIYIACIKKLDIIEKKNQSTYTLHTFRYFVCTLLKRITLNNLDPDLKRQCFPTIRLERTPGRIIQNDYESCNIGVRIDTSRSPSLPFYSSGFQGSDRVVGARPTGLDWLTRLAWSQPTSPWFSPASFATFHPPFLTQLFRKKRRGVSRNLTTDFLKRWHHLHLDFARLLSNQ